MKKKIFFKGIDLEKLYKEANTFIEKENADIISSYLIVGEIVETGKDKTAQEYIIHLVYKPL